MSDDGQRVVELMAEYLTTSGVAVDHIEHSEKLPARQTAEAVAREDKATKWDEGNLGVGSKR